MTENQICGLVAWAAFGCLLVGAGLGTIAQNRLKKAECPPEPKAPSEPPPVSVVGVCSVCGCRVNRMSDRQMAMLVLSDNPTGETAEHVCPSCGTIICMGCAVRTGKTCPKCRGPVVNPA
jgi:hypothetical protein